MAAGWPNRPMGADDVQSIRQMLEGDGEDGLPRGFAGMTPTSLTTTLTGTADVPIKAYMRIERFVLGAAACVDLSRVTDIKVGTISLNINTQPVPCVAFARDAVGTYIDAAVWASPSVAPAVLLWNATAGTIVYEGAMFGKVSLAKPADAT